MSLDATAVEVDTTVPVEAELTQKTSVASPAYTAPAVAPVGEATPSSPKPAATATTPTTQSNDAPVIVPSINTSLPSSTTPSQSTLTSTTSTPPTTTSQPSTGKKGSKKNVGTNATSRSTGQQVIKQSGTGGKNTLAPRILSHLQHHQQGKSVSSLASSSQFSNSKLPLGIDSGSGPAHLQQLGPVGKQNMGTKPQGLVRTTHQPQQQQSQQHNHLSNFGGAQQGGPGSGHMGHPNMPPFGHGQFPQGMQQLMSPHGTPSMQGGMMHMQPINIGPNQPQALQTLAPQRPHGTTGKGQQGKNSLISSRPPSIQQRPAGVSGNGQNISLLPSLPQGGSMNNQSSHQMTQQMSPHPYPSHIGPALHQSHMEGAMHGYPHNIPSQGKQPQHPGQFGLAGPQGNVNSQGQGFGPLTNMMPGPPNGAQGGSMLHSNFRPGGFSGPLANPQALPPLGPAPPGQQARIPPVSQPGAPVGGSATPKNSQGGSNTSSFNNTSFPNGSALPPLVGNRGRISSSGNLGLKETGTGREKDTDAPPRHDDDKQYQPQPPAAAFSSHAPPSIPEGMSPVARDASLLASNGTPANSRPSAVEVTSKHSATTSVNSSDSPSKGLATTVAMKDLPLPVGSSLTAMPLHDAPPATSSPTPQPQAMNSDGAEPPSSPTKVSTIDQIQETTGQQIAIETVEEAEPKAEPASPTQPEVQSYSEMAPTSIIGSNESSERASHPHASSSLSLTEEPKPTMIGSHGSVPLPPPMGRPIGQGIRTSPHSSPRPTILRKSRTGGGEGSRKMLVGSVPPSSLPRPPMGGPRGQMLVGPMGSPLPQQCNHPFAAAPPPIGGMISYVNEQPMYDGRMPPDAGSNYLSVTDDMRDQYLRMQQQQQQPMLQGNMPPQLVRGDKLAGSRLAAPMPPHINGVENTESPRKKRRKQQVIVSEDAYPTMHQNDAHTPAIIDPPSKDESDEDEITLLAPGKRHRPSIYGYTKRTYFDVINPSLPYAVENIPHHYVQPGSARWAERTLSSVQDYNRMPNFHQRLHGGNLKHVLVSGIISGDVTSEQRCKGVMDRLARMVKTLAEGSDSSLLSDTLTSLGRIKELAE
eukprot:Ihof_evm16s17 gene=Ihof_evmTU16s17